jgi:KipI family sensor histidine kinase inhibitor
MVTTDPKFRTLGDRGLLVELGEGISAEVNRRVQALFQLLEAAPIPGVLEAAPAYRSLLVVYDPLVVSRAALVRQIGALARRAAGESPPPPRTVTVPVVYGGAQGPDLAEVSRLLGLPADEVVRRHSEAVYRVYMIGFTPGYPYMGELPAELAVPRRSTPRTRVPKGSVGIAQRQTGIYPVDSPGGWQIIGWTPLELFDPRRQPPALLEMGDAVRFTPIGLEEAGRWRA